jgi:hypothetical protein
VTIGPAAHDRVELASRYLGPELGRWYVDNTPSDVTVDVRFAARALAHHDFAKRCRSAQASGRSTSATSFLGASTQ